MPDPSFEIATDKSRRFVTIAFEPAFWDEATKRRFIEACIIAVISLDCEPGTQVILVDLRNAVLQSQQLVGTMQKFLGDPRAGRVALVADAPLARMQTRRLQVRDDVRLFSDIPTAETWLFRAGGVRAA